MLPSRNGDETPGGLPASDLTTLLRKEMVEHADQLTPFGFQMTDRALVQAAAACEYV